MLGTILVRKFPDLIPGKDWVVRQDDEVAGSYLEQWNSATIPKPTDGDLKTWNDEFTLDPLPTVDEKLQTIAFTQLELGGLFEALYAILAGEKPPDEAIANVKSGYTKVVEMRK